MFTISGELHAQRPRRAAMVQEGKNDEDSGRKYVLCHDEISERPEVHGYHQLRGFTEGTNSLEKSKAHQAVSLAYKKYKNAKIQARNNHALSLL